VDFKTHKPVLIGGALALVFAGLLAASAPPASPLLQRVVVRGDSRLPRGTLAPDFQLPTRQGKTLGLEQFKGRSSLLIFVTPTCPYCKKLKEELLGRGLPDLQNRLAFISREKPGELQGVPAEVQQLEARITGLFPVLQDSAGSVSGAYKVQGVPTSYWMDEQGKVRASAVGMPEGLKLVDGLVAEVVERGTRTAGE
jgi:peroxiredoxin